VPYDRPIVGPNPQTVTTAVGPVPATQRSRLADIPAPGDPDRWPAWTTVLAFGVVTVPFAVAVVRLLASPSGHLTLPDDLALIDLHTRRALVWKQQLGVFDHNNWNHPGPTYFYLLSVVYRVFGWGARSLFLGATLLNALAALCCVGVVRRRATPARALWAALWICLLASVLAASGTAATTYSESVLGALVSPWNPVVVIFPLLLLILLCAGAVDRSGPSLVGALLVGSYLVQTDISTLPVVAVAVALSGAVWLVTVVRDRVGEPMERDSDAWRAGGAGPILVAGGLVLLALMWVAPVVQEATGHPGNLTLLYDFFTSSHPGYPLSAGLWSFAAAAGILVEGPAEVMGSLLGGTPLHASVAVAVALVAVLTACAVLVVGLRQRLRFAAGIGLLSLAGYGALIVGVTRVVGFVFGYLVVWAVALPVSACIGVGMLRAPLGGGLYRRRPVTSTLGFRIGLAVVALAAGVLLCVRVVAIPPLERVSDPDVGRLAALVTPHLDPHGRVAVGDGGAGTAQTQLLDTEEFIGLVDLLDQGGYHPAVNHFWRAQFGPGYQEDGTEDHQVLLTTWTRSSPLRPGYLGRIGDMAVTVTGRAGRTPAPGSVP
jgi:hypothetical protein